MSKNIVVFDTETTNLEKPFCYNIGFVIYDIENNEVLYKNDFVAEQIWHNKELFTTAYYSDKREGYISRMKGKKCTMAKLGYITQKMSRLFEEFEVIGAFAYNSPFDTRVFDFNCEWFKIINPFDNIPIYDIRGYVHQYLAFNKDYQKFCDDNKYYTESGNYSTTAETVFRYLSKNTDFIEEHTALADSEIELEVLKYCLSRGAELCKDYKVYNSIPRNIDKTLTVKDVEGNIHNFNYEKILIHKNGESTKIYLKKKKA